MSRDFRKPRNVSSRHVQWFALATLGFLLRLVVFSGVFVYQVSPLRDSSFQPNSANAGSLIPWMQGVGEDTWLLGASVLAGLLTTNLVFIFWQCNQSIANEIPKPLRLTFSIGLGAILFILIDTMFLFYLLAQWIVD
jgi:hypothetical protein